MGLFEVSDEELYQDEIRRPLAEKIEIALARIREYEPVALSLSEHGYYVAFSGGKDSIVLERLFKMAGVKYQAWYNNVTIDPPELVRFIKDFYPEVQWNNRGKHLCNDIVNHAPGLPTRMCRWCCSIYKEQGGNGLFKAIGVRGEESPRRKAGWSFLSSDKKGNSILCPIIHWTDEDVWQFIRDQKMGYCSLYDEGFKRLGCIGCPLGGNNRRKEFKRWPEYEKMWKRGGMAWFEKYRAKQKKDGSAYFAAKFKSFGAYWSWWMQEKNVNDTDKPDCQGYLW